MQVKCSFACTAHCVRDKISWLWILPYCK